MARGGPAVAVLALAACALAPACAGMARLRPDQVALAEAKRLDEAGQLDAGLAEAERALKLAKARAGQDDLDVAQCLHVLGDLSRRRGDTNAAERYIQQALTIRKAALGPRHLAVALTLESFALIYRDEAMPVRQQTTLEAALDIAEAAPGAKNPHLPRLLTELANLLSSKGEHGRAQALLQQALSIQERELGPTHPDVAGTLSDLGIAYTKQAQFAQAEPLLQRALSIREAATGHEKARAASADAAVALNNLAFLYMAQGLYERAEPLFERALAAATAAGASAPAVARTMTNLATVYVHRGAYERAELLFQKALAIQENSRAYRDAAATLTSLAQLFILEGSYSRAAPLIQRALAIWDGSPGWVHLEMANSLNAWANMFVQLGQYKLAIDLQERALLIRESNLGSTHPDTVTSLNNLALCDIKLGLYRKAEPLLQRAVAAAESTLGAAHPNLAAPLLNLAHLYSLQGLYDRQEPLLQRALAIREGALDREHPLVAQSLNDLGWLHAERGEHARAEPLYERALSIYRKAFGEDHPEVATTLTNLANVQITRKRYDRAEALLWRALATREAHLGKSNPAVAITLSSLAALYQVQGQYGRAEPALARALQIWEGSFGKSHPELVTLLNGYGLLRVQQGRLADGVPYFARALAVSEDRLRLEALDFSESRLGSFLEHLVETESHLYSVLREHPGNPEMRRLALTAALLFRGRSVEEAADTSRTILRNLGPEDRRAFQHLRDLRTRFAKLSLDGPGQRSADEHRRLLESLTGEADALEADLAKRSAPLRALTALPSPADVVERVAATLSPRSALVELVKYQDQEPVSRPGGPRAAQARYLALVLFPEGRIAAADLGPARAIDSAASRLRDALASQDVGFRAAAAELYRLAFRPLVPLLGDARSVILAPDGQLSLVPFAALHDGHRFLADAFKITYVTSGRDLLPQPEVLSRSGSVVVFADPDYGTPPGPAQADSEWRPGVERLVSERGAGLSALRWLPLPSTREEGEAIQRLFPRAQLLLGANASKERLIHLDAPGILHIASHGFFLEDAEALSGTRGLGNSGPEGPAIPRLEDPLLRSGLVLASASASAPEELSRSLVTALELAGLDLWGTQLVVLSACDTGRGDVKRGQGVYGLRRALVVAGAETLVVSLWKVNDATTRSLMERYYRNLLAGRGRAAALEEAMLALRAQHPHPHFWAPFIAIGRDAPLRGMALP